MSKFQNSLIKYTFGKASATKVKVPCLGPKEYVCVEILHLGEIFSKQPPSPSSPSPPRPSLPPPKGLNEFFFEVVF
jgi:hypothetical protein